MEEDARKKLIEPKRVNVNTYEELNISSSDCICNYNFFKYIFEVM